MVDQEQLAGLAARLEAGETVAVDDQEPLGPDRFAGQVLGLVWDELALERVTAHVDVDERHHQPYGIVHGGVWCAVVESMASLAAGLRVAGSGRYVVGVSNQTDFLRAHRLGRVDGLATPVHVGRSQQLWQVVLTRASDGRAVARGQVRLQNLQPEQVGGA